MKRVKESCLVDSYNYCYILLPSNISTHFQVHFQRTSHNITQPTPSASSAYVSEAPNLSSHDRPTSRQDAHGRVHGAARRRVRRRGPETMRCMAWSPRVGLQEVAEPC